VQGSSTQENLGKRKQLDRRALKVSAASGHLLALNLGCIGWREGATGMGRSVLQVFVSAKQGSDITLISTVRD
jgi:hypothetical protein